MKAGKVAIHSAPYQRCPGRPAGEGSVGAQGLDMAHVVCYPIVVGRELVLEWPKKEETGRFIRRFSMKRPRSKVGEGKTLETDVNFVEGNLIFFKGSKTAGRIA